MTPETIAPPPQTRIRRGAAALAVALAAALPATRPAAAQDTPRSEGTLGDVLTVCSDPDFSVEAKTAALAERGWTPLAETDVEDSELARRYALLFAVGNSSGGEGSMSLTDNLDMGARMASGAQPDRGPGRFAKGQALLVIQQSAEFDSCTYGGPPDPDDDGLAAKILSGGETRGAITVGGVAGQTSDEEVPTIFTIRLMDGEAATEEAGREVPTTVAVFGMRQPGTGDASVGDGAAPTEAPAAEPGDTPADAAPADDEGSAE